MLEDIANLIYCIIKKFRYSCTAIEKLLDKYSTWWHTILKIKLKEEKS